MKCEYCRKVELTHKNRHPLETIDIDTRKKVVMLVCNGCFEGVEKMKAEADAKAKVAANASS